MYQKINAHFGFFILYCLLLSAMATGVKKVALINLYIKQETKSRSFLSTKKCIKVRYNALKKTFLLCFKVECLQRFPVWVLSGHQFNL